MTPGHSAPSTAASDLGGAERRHVTVMFCDLAGSTELSVSVDPEELRDLIAAYQARVSEAVARNHGYVAKFMGDGILIYFGYPYAQEDDAERSVRCALAIIAGVDSLASAIGPARVRIGIATGLVVVGDLIGSGTAQERNVVGETPNLAARLQGLAPPNGIVIAEATRRLIGRLFDVRSIGAVALKGFPAPVEAFEVTGVSTVVSRFEALRDQTPLIGRSGELAQLLNRWDLAKSGQGQVVLIQGDPGIGKSRLAVAVSENIPSIEYMRLRYFCSPHHVDRALHPVIVQLETVARITSGDTAATKLDRLRMVTSRGGGEHDDFALLAELLYIDGGPVLQLTPEKKKQRTLEALVRQLEGLSARKPIMLLFEDLHWVDPTTLDLLGMIIERIVRLRALLILTFRPEFEPPWTDSRSHVATIFLNGLDQRGATDLIRAVSGGDALPADLARQIWERSDGVPLFLEEVTRTVIEQQPAAGKPSSRARKHQSDFMPTSLSASLMARLDRLAPGKDVAQMASVIGRSFHYRLLAAVSNLGEPALHAALAQLLESGLISQRGSAPDATYLFKHALVQDAAYGSLLRSKCQELHGRIATVLEADFSDIAVEQPELVGYHCAAAGLPARAIRHWNSAIQRALEKSAIKEAISNGTKALNALEDIDSADERLRLELETLSLVVNAEMARFGYTAPETRSTLDRLRVLSVQLGETARVLPILHVQYVLKFQGGDIRGSQDVARDMCALATDPMGKLIGFRALAQSDLMLAEFVSAAAAIEIAVAHLDPELNGSENDFTYSFSPKLASITCRGNAAHIWLMTGSVDRAISSYAQAFEAASRLGSPFGDAVLRNHACCFDVLFADWPALQRNGAAMAALGRQHGFKHFELLGTCFDAVAQGRLVARLPGPDEFERPLHELEALGAVLGIPLLTVLRAELELLYGDALAALEAFDRAYMMIDKGVERWFLVEVLRLRGAANRILGKRKLAQECRESAWDLARRQQAPWWQMRLSLADAELYLEEGDPVAARATLAPWKHLYESNVTGGAIDTLRALAVRSGVGGSPDRHVRGPMP
jgi:class 3 adenylate cyclase/tetratricopeptide (TPR) repeat protein